MSVEIVMMRESFDCLEKLVPAGLAERMEVPPVFLHGSGTAPHQVVLNCTLEVAEELLALARPSCGPAAEAQDRDRGIQEVHRRGLMARRGELTLSCCGLPRALSDRRYLKQGRAERTHE